MKRTGMYAPLSTREKAKATTTRKPATKTPIVPVPADAPEMNYRHPKHGKPDEATAYHDGDGQLVGYVCRWKLVEAGEPAKLILPVTFCALDRQRTGWRSKGMPAPRPLLGLPTIKGHPDRIAIVGEGEKTCAAVQRLFPAATATTPAHGAKSPHLTDFATLAGRIVVIATDHDEPGRTDDKGKPHHPGRDFGDKVAELLRAAGAAKVLFLAPEIVAGWRWSDGKRVERGAPIPDGWDLADAIEEGWTAERIAEVVPDLAALPAYPEPTAAEAAPVERFVSPFRVASNGVEKRIERADREAGTVAIEWKWFCSALAVEAETRSADGEEWGRLLRITDRDGRAKGWAMPMSMMAGDGTAYREILLGFGLVMAPGRFARDALHEFISTARPGAKARCVTRTGWHRKGFTFTADTMDSDNTSERVIFQRGGAIDHALREAGTVESWQNDVARFAVGNSRLVLALSVAFAAPLLDPTGSESGGFHFRGASSTGKSTALIVAGSAWGGGGIRGYVRSWRSTSNGLEGIAALHCDMPLCLDEMGQVDGREAGSIAYMLANGVGKVRANRHGEARPPAEWRLLFLSSGELSLADKIAEDGRGHRATAGQEVRIVDIPADAGAGLGLFENLHGLASPDAFARHLKAAAAVHYGHPSRRFVRHLVDNFDLIVPTVRGYLDEFLAENCPAGADGQVSRVAARFGLVAAGGEMATAMGVLPWPKGEATRAAARCFADWLAMRGGIEPAEERGALAAVRRFIELHGNSRFEVMGELMPRTAFGEPIEQRVINRAGFRRRAESGGIEYIILQEAWRMEVCAGFDPTMVAKTLLARGMLMPGSGGKLQSYQRLPGFTNPVRCYLVTPEIMGGASDA